MTRSPVEHRGTIGADLRDRPARYARIAATAAALAVVTSGIAGGPVASAADPGLLSWLGSDFNNVGIGDTGEGNANIDGNGGYIIRQSLDAMSLTPGKDYTLANDPTVHVVLGGAVSGLADNVVGSGQTLNSSVALGSGAVRAATKIAFVGAGTSANQTNQPVTLTYSDGSTQTISVTLTDWCSGAGSDGNERFGSISPRWYNNSVDTGTQCGLWSTTIYPLATGKQLDGVSLPVNSRFHVFGIASDALAGNASLAATSAPTVAPASGDTTVRYGSGAVTLAVPVAWAVDGVVTTYQWYADDAVIANATSKAYSPRRVDIGKTLRLVATGRKSGYAAPGTATSNGVPVLTGILAVTTEPAIGGDARVGSTLTITAGEYSASDVDEAYQWLADGDDIAGATGETLVLSPALLGKTLTAEVTASRDGYEGTTTLATGAATVALGTITATATPAITGTAKVGQLLAASAGSYSVPDVGLSYQWLANGDAIAGANAATLTPSSAEQGKAIAVSVTATKPGYTSLTTVSAATAAVAAPNATIVGVTEVPGITGSAQVGSKLTASPGSYTEAGVALSYQWLRSGRSISGATGSSYVLTASDYDQVISVQVVASKPGLTSAVATSAATSKVKLGTITATRTPVVKGTARVGHKLTAGKAGFSVSGVAVATRWLRNGKPIAGATKSTYRLKWKDHKQKVSVRVTATKTGYATTTTVSRTRKVR